MRVMRKSDSDDFCPRRPGQETSLIGFNRKLYLEDHALMGAKEEASTSFGVGEGAVALRGAQQRMQKLLHDTCSHVRMCACVHACMCLPTG